MKCQEANNFLAAVVVVVVVVVAAVFVAATRLPLFFYNLHCKFSAALAVKIVWLLQQSCRCYCCCSFPAFLSFCCVGGVYVIFWHFSLSQHCCCFIFICLKLNVLLSCCRQHLSLIVVFPAIAFGKYIFLKHFPVFFFVLNKQRICGLNHV